MRHSTLGLVLLGLFLVAPLQGQEQPRHTYLAFFKISYADLEEWNRNYWEYSVPILEDLQEQGLIEGFNQWQHAVGSEYNIRFAVRTYDWASIDTFWSEYLSRLSEANPDADGSMIQAHRDEIWDIGEAHIPQSMNAPAYIYSATWRYNFADAAEWNRTWSETIAPILDGAMAEGLLGGWVKLNHNTGGPHNSKVLYFFEEFDDIDDLFAKVYGDMPEDVTRELQRMTQAHDDVIWQPTTR